MTWREVTMIEAMAWANGRVVADDHYHGDTVGCSSNPDSFVLFEDDTVIAAKSEWTHWSDETGSSSDPPTFWIKS
jgi:hypothetical protein